MPYIISRPVTRCYGGSHGTQDEGHETQFTQARNQAYKV